MKKISTSLLIFFVLLFTVQVNAVTRYIDFSVGVGSDANDGMTEGQAWLTESYADTQLSTNDILRYVQAQDDDANGVLADWEALANDGVITQTKEIKQWAITWTIDGYERFGRYANGDFWVYTTDPNISLTAIDPISTVDAGRTKNGSMINLTSLGTRKQGYDSSSVYFDASYNKALDSDFPITIPTESSLISSKSFVTVEDRQVSDMSILTVVDTVPDTGDFRPAYAGTDKTSLYNVSDIPGDVYTTILQKVTPLGSVISQGLVERIVQRPRVETIVGFEASKLMPVNNMDGYGQDVSRLLGQVALWLHLDKTDSQKQTLLYSFLQVGIDYYGLAINGYHWDASGGHRNGRLWSILFAGIVFSDASMKTVDGTIFSENDQSIYVDESFLLSFPFTRGTFSFSGGHWWGFKENGSSRSVEWLEYVTYHLGMPEWIGGNVDNGNLLWSYASSYRRCCTATAYHGMILSALMTNYGEADWGKTVWDHNSIFDYQDRFAIVEKDDTFEYDDVFAFDMWEAYRPNYGTPWTKDGGGNYDTFAAATPTNIALVSKTFNSITVSWSSTADFNDISDQTTGYLSVTSPYIITGLNPSTSYEIEVWGRKANGIRSLVPDELTVTTLASPTSLVAHYKMDDAAGQTVVVDATGNNHTGTAANNIVSTTGKIGNAITFNFATPDYITIGSQAAFQITTNLTLTAWFKTTDVNGGILISRDDDTNRDYVLYVRDSGGGNKASFYTYQSDVLKRVTGDSSVNDGEWHMVAGVMDGTKNVLYVDGVLQTETVATSSIDNDSVDLVLGMKSPDAQTKTPFPGDIDDVRIYNVALTASQIRSLIGGGLRSRYTDGYRTVYRGRYN